MPGDYFLGNRPDQSGSFVRKILIGVCLSVLLLSAVIFGYLYIYNARLSSVLPAFQKSIDTREYDKALSMYRDIQAQVLNQDPNASSSGTNEKQVMGSMEDFVYVRVDDIENRIRTDRYVPSADDRAFLEQMGELTGSRLTIWLQSLCKEFLLGTIEKPTLQFVFDQVGDYSNVVSAASPLENEIDVIEIAKGDVQTAEKYYAEQSYIPAVEKYTDIINSYSGFVKAYASTRLEECKKTMYDPIMEECDQLILNYRYYTAEEILSDMARIFPDDKKVQAKLLTATSNTALVVPYTGRVEMVCIKPLIADTTLAFSSSGAASTDALMLTTGEFKAILEQLYAKNYILIDIHSMADLSTEGVVSQKPLMLPEGKKPIVIVLENLNYSANMYGLGTCNRLVLDEQGMISGEYVNSSGQTVVSRDSEAIGILDAFVEKNPDFSFDGSKGIVSFSGYETVMGYITNEDQLDDRNAALTSVGLPTANPSKEEILQNQTNVKAIMSRLTETGWNLASSTYGFINANSSDLTEITNDTNKWLDQVGSLTGKADVLIYPNGDFVKGTDPRCVFLKDKGFRIFSGVGPTAYYAFGDNYLYLDRALLNGDTLRNMDYSRFFQVSSVYDPARKTPLNG